MVGVNSGGHVNGKSLGVPEEADALVGYLVHLRSRRGGRHRLLVLEQNGGSGVKTIDAIRAGEEMVYYIYVGENYTSEDQVGTFTMDVPNTMTYQGASCYQANYSLIIENFTRSGSMLFDELGRMRYYIGYSQSNDNVDWITEITCYMVLNKVRVQVAYPGQTVENEIEMPASLTVAEHFLYLMRVEDFENGYYGEFNFASLPDATRTVAVGVGVTGEGSIEVPAGSYDCWVLEAGGGWVGMVWVSKEEKLLAKFVEGDFTYVLQEAKYWQ